MSVPEVTVLRELTLIVAGISPVLPSLFWMMVLLSLFVFGRAVFTTTEVIGKDPTCRLCFTVPRTEEEARGFLPDVPMSMYTLFYCLGEGCPVRC